ncbi:hypothetical protein LTR94_036696, partial [Friedmanniomyces endolithicus]
QGRPDQAAQVVARGDRPPEGSGRRSPAHPSGDHRAAGGQAGRSLDDDGGPRAHRGDEGGGGERVHLHPAPQRGGGGGPQ